MSPESRFQRAIGIIDGLNGQDPNKVQLEREEAPRELVHSHMMTDWVLRLDPGASCELLLAARAHHLQRWKIPRDSYPDGRSGYLRWRTGLHTFHATEAAKVLGEVGYSEEFISRVKDIICKRNLRRDPEVQTLEDALCLVFLETGFRDLRNKYGDDKTTDILRKTIKKMSAEGARQALALELPKTDHDFLAMVAADG